MELFNFKRRQATTVQIGCVAIGGNNPISLQSMTNTSTMDTDACVAQTKRIVEAGGDIVRLTTQGIREAENLCNINIALRKQNIFVPLVADVHFNAKVADISALYAEKVRINPGNYVDPARKFEHLEYTDEAYAEELKHLEVRFVSFLKICKENNTAIRIGVNHGSLSDRIMSRYGNTPAGIVESCMEFLRICAREKFTNVVISVKSSNTIVMVQSVRQLIAAMEKEDMFFPLHLGVTEAGDGEDGRIKSALGTGALLADGIGDTIRVSLSEPPECEIPVAKELVNHFKGRENHPYIPATACADFNYLCPQRRETQAVRNIGGDQVPVVIADRMDGGTEVNPQFTPDYIYAGTSLREGIESGEQQYIVDAPVWTGVANTWPAFQVDQLYAISSMKSSLKFLFLTYLQCGEEVVACLKNHPEIVVIAQSNHPNRLGELRALAHQLMNEKLKNPLIIFQHYQLDNLQSLQIDAAADCGALTIDGFCDGLYLYNQGTLTHAQIDAVAFGILQAARLRTSKTEYISCPGCGRTMYDLEDTIKKIKAATTHLTGLKIGIMGCIVNGPGEMEDADYGYVGAGRGKISLYKGHHCMIKNIPQEEAVDRLLEFIEEDRKKQ
ncbi:MAG: 4-hydroxy-3-methylbut-2-en-1-yl diphosphate synthase [Bacteroidaceae bacterium]